jgi:hypothetical protein
MPAARIAAAAKMALFLIIFPPFSQRKLEFL